MTVLPLLLDQLHQLEVPYAAQCDDRLLVAILLALAQPTATPPQTRTVLVRLQTDHCAAEDDTKEAVRRIAGEVAWICTAVFALTAHSVECTPAQSPQTFLRVLFPSEAGADAHPSSQQRDSRNVQPPESNESTNAPRRRSLPRRRSSVPLAISVQAANEQAGRTRDDVRTPTRLPRRARRSKSQEASSPLSSDHFVDAAMFSDYTGPNPEDGDSSAGEDLYPTSISPTTASFRSAAMSRRIGSADSVSFAGSSSRPLSSERRRSSVRGRRRYSVSSPTRSRAVSQGDANEGIGVGLATPTRSDNLPAGPNGLCLSGATPRRQSDADEVLALDGTRADSARTPSSSALPPHMQQASYLQQAERRPSIASIQNAMQGSGGVGSQPVTLSEQTSVAVNDYRTPLSTRRSSPSISFATPPASPPRSRGGSGFAAHPISRVGSSTYPPAKPGLVSTELNDGSPSSSTVSKLVSEANAPTAPSAEGSRALPQVLIVQHLERARPSVQDELLAVLRDRRVTVSLQVDRAESQATGPSRGDGPRSTDPQSRVSVADSPAEAAATGVGQSIDSPQYRTSARRAERTHRVGLALETRQAETWNLPDGFLCVAIVCEPEERGSRRQPGRDRVSRYTVDRFSVSYSIPLERVLTSGSHFLPPTLHPLSAPTQALLHPLPLPIHALPDYISDSLDTYISDLVSALRHHPRLETRMLTARAVKDLRRMTGLWAALTKGEGSLRLGDSPSAEARASSSTFRPATASPKSTRSSASSSLESTLTVLPADVLAVLVSVLSHRLSVRDPRHEASLFWGSTIEALEARHREDRATVEDLIREVVAVV